MKNLVTTIKVLTLVTVLMSVSACISVKREAPEPSTSVTTTSATVAPTSTTRVERTTTY